MLSNSSNNLQKFLLVRESLSCQMKSYNIFLQLWNIFFYIAEFVRPTFWSAEYNVQKSFWWKKCLYRAFFLFLSPFFGSALFLLIGKQSVRLTHGQKKEAKKTRERKKNWLYIVHFLQGSHVMYFIFWWVYWLKTNVLCQDKKVFSRTKIACWGSYVFLPAKR